MKDDRVHDALNPEKDIKGMNAIDPIQLAKYYTGGDEIKAQQMLSGEYNDMYVIKLRIATIDIYAACIIFYNHIYNRILDISGVISKSYDIEDISISDQWQEFESKIVTCLNKKEHDKGKLVQFLHRIQDRFTEQFGTNMLSLITLNDTKELKSFYEKQIINHLHLDVMRFNVDYEEISSIIMENESKTSVKLQAEQILNETIESEPTADMQDSSTKIEEMKAESDGIDEKNIKEVFNGELVLAPTHGMHVSGLVCKDKIKVRLTDSTNKAIVVAKAFNAFKDNKMLPIIGTVVSFRRKKDSGYKIFVELVEGLFVRIDEDQDNIKVEFVAPSPDRDQKLQVGITNYVDKHVNIIEKDKRKKAKLLAKKSDPQKELKAVKNSFVLFLVVIIMILGVLYILLS